MPGSFMLSTLRPWPVRNLISSRRLSGWSTYGIDGAASVILVGLQKVSTHGRSSTSRDQALLGWRRTSI